MKRRLFCAALAAIFVLSLAIAALPVSAAEVIGQVLSTDIRAYINGYEIPAYNIDGKLAVVVADLNHYGFATQYDNGARKTTVTRKNSAFTPVAASSASLPVGTPVMSVYSSDITVELDGERVQAFNVDNRMAIYFSELKRYGTYVYDDQSRASKLTLTGSAAKNPEKTAGGGTNAVYSTDKYLYIDEIPVYGVVRIGNEYYIPVEVLDNPNISLGAADLYQKDNCWQVNFRKPSARTIRGVRDETVRLVDYTRRPVSGNLMGYAEKASVRYQVNGKAAQSGVYTLGGKYPMLPLKGLGAVSSGSDFKITLDSKTAYSHEKDLLGDTLGTLQKATVAETAKALHDAIVNRFTYSFEKGKTQLKSRSASGGDNQLSAAPSVQNPVNYAWDSAGGICEDYADTFNVMCARMGIPCIGISGWGGGGNHAWNLVYIDGKWTHVDVTFDDPVGGGDILRHDYFMRDGDYMVSDHDWNGDDYPMPEHYDPAWEQLDPMNITSADMFRKCLVAQIAQKKTSFTLRNTVPGAYSGIACMMHYRNEIDLNSFSVRYFYNEEANQWEYTFDYSYFFRLD